MQLEIVKTALAALNLRLMASQRYRDDELTMCSAMIVDDLPTWGPERFLNAVREYRRTANFIPTSADLLKADGALGGGALPELKSLPAAPRDKAAEAENARKWWDKIRALPGFGGLRLEDAGKFERGRA